MPNDSQDEETGVARLPAPTRAPEDNLAQAEFDQPPALSDEDLKARQDAMGTRRKPAGPRLGEGPATGAQPLEQVEDVPETEVTEAAEFDPDNPDRGVADDGDGGDDGGDDGGREPLESSERE
jgi:hypothetical protein